jgi:hypothetical protein
MSVTERAGLPGRKCKAAGCWCFWVFAYFLSVPRSHLFNNILKQYTSAVEFRIHLWFIKIVPIYWVTSVVETVVKRCLSRFYSSRSMCFCNHNRMCCVAKCGAWKWQQDGLVPVSDVFLVRITGRVVPIGPRSFHSFRLFNDTQLFQLYCVECRIIS